MESSILLHREHPTLDAIVSVVIGTLLMAVVSFIVVVASNYILGLQTMNQYLVQGLVDGISFLIFVLFLKAKKHLFLFREKKVSFISGLFIGGYLVFKEVITLLSSLPLVKLYDFVPFADILSFIGCMFLIGCAEETLFRGIVCNMLFEAYGNTRAGVRFCVVFSGSLFGLFHLSNLGAGIPVSSVMAQVTVAAGLGMIFAAIYYRTRNLWVVIILHAFQDFVGLFASGMLGQGSLEGVITEYGIQNLIPLCPIIITIVYLLRNKGVDQALENSPYKTEQLDSMSVAKNERRFTWSILLYIAILVASIVLIVFEKS